MKVKSLLFLGVLSAFVGLDVMADDLSDYPEVIHDLVRKGQSGDVQAQFELGEKFYWGADIVEDYSQALKWYKLAADQGHSDAQNNLGSMYHYGNGTEKRPDLALELYRASAAKNNPWGMYSLCLLYTSDAADE